MAEWDADLYLTGSQKALGVPPGLALMVASGRAVAARAARRAPPPPMVLDWDLWLPIMAAYEERRASYFSTPATNLILALAVALEEILAEGTGARVERHRRAAEALRAAWRALGLTPLPVRDELAAHTLSALYFPAGIGPSLVGRIREQGVIVAGGLLSGLKDRYFRVGHMGYAVTRPEMLERTVAAVAAALAAEGVPVPAELPGVSAVAALVGVRPAARRARHGPPLDRHQAPLPADRRRAAAEKLTLEALAARGVRVTVVAPVEPAAAARVAAEIAPFARPALVAAPPVGKLAALLAARPGGLPLAIARHRRRDVEEAVARELAAGSFAAVHVEQVHALPQAAPAAARGLRIVLRAQNVESDLWRAAAARGGLGTGAGLAAVEARRLAVWEARAVARWR